MKIEISNGEIYDKFSILEVKSLKLKDLKKLEYVNKEFLYLKKIIDKINFFLEEETYKKLKDINFRLWDIEDEIRAKEEMKDFSDRFIELSRLIYQLNDERFRLKNEINIKTNSNFKEQKGYNKILLK